MLTIKIDDSDLIEQSYKTGSNHCCEKMMEKICLQKKVKKVSKAIVERQMELYPSQFDPIPEEELEEKNLQTQAEIEKTKDDEVPPNVDLENNEVQVENDNSVVPNINLSAPQINEAPIEEEKQQETLRNVMQSRINFQEGNGQIPPHGEQLNVNLNIKKQTSNVRSITAGEQTIRGAQEEHGVK